jgi:hypothetical protein
MLRFPLSRRDWLRFSAAGIAGTSVSGVHALAADAANHPQRRRACIVLWMDGGPSQTDTFDLKPGHPNGGPFKETQTSVPGLRISEHLPGVARHAKHLAIVRSMTTREGDHGPAAFHVRTGYSQGGEIRYPPIGALLAKELGAEEAVLPNFVSIAPNRAVNPAAHGPGFLGPIHAPLVVGSGRPAAGQLPGPFDYDRALKVQDLASPPGVLPAHADVRMELLSDLEQEFVKQHPDQPPVSHQAAYRRAAQLMHTVAARAFNLEEEKDSLRNAYGRNLFGQGCLLARRLVEQGVAFVEVTMGGLNGGGLGWDTHTQNFQTVQSLSAVLDPAWATLMDDLGQRGLLDSTLVVWMGEFGRTPRINGQQGRDHFPNAWSTVLAGGGIRGGQVVGNTGTDGMMVKDRPVTVPDLLATVCRALGVDPTKQNQSNVGRPIRIVDKAAKPIEEVLA